MNLRKHYQIGLGLLLGFLAAGMLGWTSAQLDSNGFLKVVLGTGSATIGSVTVTSPVVTRPHARRDSTWLYAAASGGITNGTAVTIKAAGATGVRHCITALQVENTDQQDSTEFSIRDGSGGTVLWRWKLLTGGHGVAPPIQTPICGSAATLLEVICATSGTVTFFNAQGYSTQE